MKNYVHGAAAAGIALALAFSASAEPSSGARPFDFKGVALGTTIEEFRAMPHPDGKAAEVVCTGEKIEVTRNYSREPIDVMVFDETEKTLGVRRCVWITVDSPYGKGSAAMLSLASSGYGTGHYSFSFVTDPVDGEMRLFKFMGTSNAAAYPATIEALTGKWGKPVTEKGTVQNRIGNTFDKETAVWANPAGSILVESRFSKIDDMAIIMTDARLSKIVVDAEAAAKAAKPNAI
ncbi:hypothetical protein [Sphingopyxis sp. 113P3]|uniref:hypothetical protein n=1 Tax=Sphingopyxis sp. (strain 113P3) TaxID=292913 RepID=UPI0006AD4F68|nr:hypothetical protein [Sphingopyxis sp. 113P3]ALC12511.1 hypothetical protein LH20_11165 [Sphingopyxis sp. 113P3]